MAAAPGSLAGQVAIVTGASSGIGRGIAHAMAAAGARVTINYHRDRPAGEQVVAEIAAAGGTAIAIDADVREEAAVEALVDGTRTAFGAVDILVANAGIQKDAPFDELTLADFNDVIAVNLTGQFLCMRAVIRQFLQQGIRPGVSRSAGKIICISSVHEVIPWPGHANYAASKGGVSMLMKSVALEYARRKIRVNSIAPGAITTPLNRDSWETPAAREALLRLIPYGRLGDPADIGRAAVWLASDDSEYVVGATLTIDGGAVLYASFEEGEG